MSQSDQVYQVFQARLSECGLNLCAAFDSAALSASLKSSLPACAFEQASSVLLVGTKGQEFWQHLQSGQQAHGHCFDRETEEIVIGFLKQYFPQYKTLQLYPGSKSLIPLQKLGQSVGWGQASVLGLDIHPQYGTWFAYRCCLIVFGVLPAAVPVKINDVCARCITKPCQTACPAKAVKTVGKFDLDACLGHRMTNGSSCAQRCFARRACPVGLDFAYSEAQLAHHSLHSLASIKRYHENNST